MEEYNEYSEKEFSLIVKHIEKEEAQKSSEQIKQKERIKMLTAKQYMIVILIMLIGMIIIFSTACQAQTNPYFRVTWQPKSEAAEYLVFVETVNVGSASRLVEDMDYLDPVSVQDLYWITIPSGTTTTRFRSPADGKELHVGIVVKKASGYYGAMTKTFLTKDTAPGKVNGLTITKE